MGPAKRKVSSRSKTGNPPKKKRRRALSPEATVKIPREVLEETLDALADPNHEAWHPRSQCMPFIHHHHHSNGEHETVQHEYASQLHKLKYARLCLMRRDWPNLAKTLTLINSTSCRDSNILRSYSYIYHICVKYGTICLAHKSEEMLNVFLSTLMPGIDADELVRKCSSFGDNENANDSDD